MPEIYPSLIAADVLNLQHTIETLDQHCAGYHLDVMDGNFVPNLTWGPMVVNEVARITYKKVWVHLMVQKPDELLDAFMLPEGSVVTFHFENSINKKDMIKKITEKKWLPSIAISPKTDVQEIMPFLDTAHHVLVMSVEPGFSGQDFIPETLEKLEILNSYKQSQNLDFIIGVDGGINENNIHQCAQHGVEQFAIASTIFKSKNSVEKITALHNALK